VSLLAVGLTLLALALLAWGYFHPLSPDCGFDCPPASGSVSNAPGP
jgi:hypothetical protein